MTEVSLVPKVAGTELYEFRPDSKTVFVRSGSGFDIDSDQHRIGCDAVRYGIAIQQMRDAGHYEPADQKRALAERLGYRVGCEKDGVSLGPVCLVDGLVFDLPPRHRKREWPRK